MTTTSAGGYILSGVMALPDTAPGLANGFFRVNVKWEWEMQPSYYVSRLPIIIATKETPYHSLTLDCYRRRWVGALDFTAYQANPDTELLTAWNAIWQAHWITKKE